MVLSSNGLGAVVEDHHKNRPGLIECLDDVLYYVSHVEGKGAKITVPASSNPRPLEEMDEQRFLTYNVARISEEEELQVLDRTGEVIGGFPRSSKPHHQLMSVLDVIHESLPDIATLQEVESMPVLRRAIDQHPGLRGRYTPVVVHGNDLHRVNTGYLIRKDLPYEVSIQSHRELKRKNGEPVFTRDAPLLLAYEDPSDPFFGILGVHYKAPIKNRKFDNSDPRGAQVREREARATMRILKETQEDLGKELPIWVMGDFNAEAWVDGELSPLKMNQEGGLIQTADLQDPPLSQKHRQTLRRSLNSQDPRQDVAIDMTLANDPAQPYVISTRVLAETDSQGYRRPWPKYREEKSTYGSDHRAMEVTIDHRMLIEDWSKPLKQMSKP